MTRMTDNTALLILTQTAQPLLPTDQSFYMLRFHVTLSTVTGITMK